jgi:hypothetical protein
MAGDTTSFAGVVAVAVKGDFVDAEAGFGFPFSACAGSFGPTDGFPVS